jgi:hypothetical protein
MRLTTQELRGLMPLLRPGVEIEIVLHGTEVAESNEEFVAKRTRQPMSAEARAAAGRRLVEGRRRKRETAEAAIVADAVAAPVTTPEPREIRVEAFAVGGTPDQRQTAVFQAEVERMKRAKADGGGL